MGVIISLLAYLFSPRPTFPHFFELPLEVRQQIYRLVLPEPDLLPMGPGPWYGKRQYDNPAKIPYISQTSSQLRHETLPIFWGDNSFSLAASQLRAHNMIKWLNEEMSDEKAGWLRQMYVTHDSFTMLWEVFPELKRAQRPVTDEKGCVVTPGGPMANYIGYSGAYPRMDFAALEEVVRGGMKNKSASTTITTTADQGDETIPVERKRDEPGAPVEAGHESDTRIHKEPATSPNTEINPSNSEKANHDETDQGTSHQVPTEKSEGVNTITAGKEPYGEMERPAIGLRKWQIARIYWIVGRDLGIWEIHDDRKLQKMCRWGEPGFE